MKRFAAIVVGLMVFFSFVRAGVAQDRTPEELDQMLGPIALYPDPLIAEILSAATFPDQIVVADRYMQGGGDVNQVAQQPWDPSVQGMCHYANVLKWLDDNLQWMTQLGQAYTAQPSDVMDSVQRLRAQAQNLGNLPSTPEETVTDDNGDIEIEPADADNIYVPDYSASTIYYQPGIFCTFGFGFPIGGWLIHDWDWHSHRMIAWGPQHPRPANWWRQSPVERRGYFAGTHMCQPGTAERAGRLSATLGGSAAMLLKWFQEVFPRPLFREAPESELRQSEARVSELPRVEPLFESLRSGLLRRSCLITLRGLRLNQWLEEGRK